MATVACKVYKTFQSYWRHRYYERLEQPLSKPLKITRLGTAQRSRKLRHVQLLFKIRTKVWSPRKLLTRARDAYMNMMLALAGGQGRPVAALKSSSNYSDGVWVRRMPKARQICVSGQSEFEKRMMLHIYNLLVARPELPGMPKMVSVSA